MPGHRAIRPASRAIPERLVKELDAFLDDGVRLSRHDLVRAHLVFQILHEVGAEDAPEATERHRQVQVDAVTHGGLLVHLVLGHQEHAESVEAGIPERQLVALVVLAEAAGAAGARRQVDVFLRHLGGADLARFLLEEIDEVARGEAGRAALADVGDLASGQKILARRHGQHLRVVAAVLQHGLQDALEPPVQPAEENRRRIALGARERLRGVGAVVLSSRGCHAILHSSRSSPRRSGPSRPPEVALWRIPAGAGSCHRPCGRRRDLPRH